MSNPARDLANLLTGWELVSSGSSIYNSRGSSSQVEPEFINQQVRACGLLGQIGTILDALDASGEDMGHYRVFLPRWWRATTMPEEQWGAVRQGGGQLWDAEVVASLRGFASLLDKTELRTAPITSESLQSSRQGLDQVLDVLKDVSLSPEVRQYLFLLITEIRNVFDSEHAKIDIDLARRICELRGFLDTLADALENDSAQSRADNGRRLRSAYKRIAPVAQTIGTTSLWGINMAVGTLAITQGLI